MPPDFCEYLATFPKALPWLLENCPKLVLSTRGGVTVEAFCAEIEAEGTTIEEAAAKSHGSRGGAARPNKSRSKKKVDFVKVIQIEKISRGKRKYITQITGLEEFEGVKLKDAAKKLGKKFACSASVNKLPNEKKCIDLQGDCCYELPDLLVEYFEGVKEEFIFFKEGGKKRPAF